MIFQKFLKKHDLINEHFAKGEGILVHCYGASQSASVIIYYLMIKYDWSYEQALNHVLCKIKLVNLSHKFDSILREKEKEIKSLLPYIRQIRC